MNTTFIYALCEPKTRIIRYIGKANHPKKRFINHCCQSKTQKSHLGHWLSVLAAQFQVPELLILKEVLKTEWIGWEQRYIRNARALGFKLVNGTDGGEGALNLSLEGRQRLRESKLGDKNPNFGKDFSGEKAPGYGRKHTLEELEKMRGPRPQCAGKQFTPERCANISAGRRRQLEKKRNAKN